MASQRDPTVAPVHQKCSVCTAGRQLHMQAAKPAAPQAQMAEGLDLLTQLYTTPHASIGSQGPHHTEKPVKQARQLERFRRLAAAAWRRF